MKTTQIYTEGLDGLYCAKCNVRIVHFEPMFGYKLTRLDAIVIADHFEEKHIGILSRCPECGAVNPENCCCSPGPFRFSERSRRATPIRSPTCW